MFVCLQTKKKDCDLSVTLSILYQKIFKFSLKMKKQIIKKQICDKN